MDREREVEYNVVAKATDGGGRSCQADIQLTVQDANDNAPRFSSSHYEVTVFDNTTVRTPVAVVYATDPDTGGLCGRVLRGRRGHCNVSSQVRTRRLRSPQYQRLLTLLKPNTHTGAPLRVCSVLILNIMKAFPSRLCFRNPPMPLHCVTQLCYLLLQRL